VGSTEVIGKKVKFLGAMYIIHGSCSHLRSAS
jgi:hypothetical protein